MLMEAIMQSSAPVQCPAIRPLRYQPSNLRTHNIKVIGSKATANPCMRESNELITVFASKLKLINRPKSTPRSTENKVQKAPAIPSTINIVLILSFASKAIDTPKPHNVAGIKKPITFARKIKTNPPPKDISRALNRLEVAAPLPHVHSQALYS